MGDFDCCANGEHDTPTKERETLARIIWESSIAFSNAGRKPAAHWGDVKVSAARQHARYVADAIIAARHDGFDHCTGCQAAHQTKEASR